MSVPVPRHLELRCSTLCYGLSKLFRITLEDWVVFGIGRTIPTAHRLVRGLDNARWTWPMVERAADVIGTYMHIPSTDVFYYFTDVPCRHADRMKELEAARFLLPNPKTAGEVQLALCKHEDFAGEIHSYQQIWPVSHMTEEPTRVHFAHRVRPLGAQSSRILGTMMTFAKQRRTLGSFHRAVQYLYMPSSKMEAMKNGKGAFPGLPPQNYMEFHQNLIEIVKTRPVRVAFFDLHDVDAQTRRFLQDFDCIMALGDQFTTSVHRGRLSRGLCSRRSGDTARSRYIEFTQQAISGLKEYVRYDMNKVSKTVEAIKAFAI